MTPYIGMPVLVRTQVQYNGSSIHPGVITRVWGDYDSESPGRPLYVNVSIFPDASDTTFLTSVLFTEQDNEPGVYQLAYLNPYPVR